MHGDGDAVHNRRGPFFHDPGIDRQIWFTLGAVGEKILDNGAFWRIEFHMRRKRSTTHTDDPRFTDTIERVLAGTGKRIQGLHKICRAAFIGLYHDAGNFHIPGNYPGFYLFHGS